MGWLDKILRMIWGARAADDADAKADVEVSCAGGSIEGQGSS